MNKEKDVFRKKKNNFKKSMKKIGKKNKSFFTNIIDKIKKTNRTVKIIVLVWVLVVLLIVGLILLCAFSNSSREKYYEMEKAMDAATLDYVETTSLYPTKDSKAKIPMESLVLDNYLYESDIADKSCTGYSIVFYNGDDKVYSIESYINCDKYTSKGYNDYIDYGIKKD